MSENKFWKGMLYGAIAGGALSLFDKNTRQMMKKNVSKVYQQVSYVVKHPSEISDQVKETAVKLKTTFEQVSDDIYYITGKVDELRELTPKVKEIVKDTQETFSKEDDSLYDDLLKEVEVKN
ncbi:YtxH domain-containing protein [Neobacillus sp. K501]